MFKFEKPKANGEAREVGKLEKTIKAAALSAFLLLLGGLAEKSAASESKSLTPEALKPKAKQVEINVEKTGIESEMEFTGRKLKVHEKTYEEGNVEFEVITLEKGEGMFIKKSVQGKGRDVVTTFYFDRRTNGSVDRMILVNGGTDRVDNAGCLLDLTSSRDFLEKEASFSDMTPKRTFADSRKVFDFDDRSKGVVYVYDMASGEAGKAPSENNKKLLNGSQFLYGSALDEIARLAK